MEKYKMTNANLSIWSSVQETNPGNTKSFSRSGGFSGTAVNPTYLAKRATELFGPIGTGWGLNVLDEKYVDGANHVNAQGAVVGHDVIHILRVELWYIQGDKKGAFQQYGQTTFVGKNKYGAFTDEEAPKKSMTDAMTKCLSLLGFSADIHLGLYDDVKYVADLKEQFKGEALPTQVPQAQAVTTPVSTAQAAPVATPAPAASVIDSATVVDKWIARIATIDAVKVQSVEDAIDTQFPDVANRKLVRDALNKRKSELQAS